ncbi:MAG: hypothetical protein GWO24_24420, partial [Akkermansiaceae bacterium]|nr:hypothetical protein [Akkermansiaceae bacterium]
VLPDLGTPVEQMEGILGIIETPVGMSSRSTRPWWHYWHLLPALAGLLLLARITRLHFLPRFRPST